MTTPAELAERLAKTLPPHGRDVLDPACGDGALLLAALARMGGGSAAERLHGIEIDPQRAATARARLAQASGLPVRLFEQTILCADALGPERWPTRTHVLANPPWLSFSGRHAARERPTSKVIGQGWPSLHGTFLVRIAEHVAREGSSAAVLLPDSVLEQDRYGPVRAAVTHQTRVLLPPFELGERAFPGVVEPAVILRLRPAKPGQIASPLPWTSLGVQERSWLARLGSFPRAPAGAFGDPGVHTGNCAAELISPASEGHWPLLRQGRDLAPFALGPPSLRLRTDLGKDTGRRFRVPSLERLAGVPVLVRQTASHPIAALHERPTYFRNSLLACYGVEGLDPRFLVGWLNSTISRTWHQLSFRDGRQRTFPQVKVGHLRSLPLPILSRKEDPRLHDGVIEAGAQSALVDNLLQRAFGLPNSPPPGLGPGGGEKQRWLPQASP